MRNILLLLLLPLLVACQASEFEIAQEKYINEMDWLQPRDDVEKAIKNKDFRFMGIYGYSISVPDVKLKCLNLEKDINPIKGTTDAVIGYEHEKLIAIARVYARESNFRMKRYRETNQGFKCGL